jgi:excinuclease UvrABC nuclease subunit
VKRIERPPTGILPKYLHDEKRLKELSQAISRYFNKNLPVKTEWIEEYNQLVEAVFKNMKNKIKCTEKNIHKAKKQLKKK